MLITSDADGGTYELYLVPKDAASGREPSPVSLDSLFRSWRSGLKVSDVDQGSKSLCTACKCFQLASVQVAARQCADGQGQHGLVGGLLMPHPCTQ